MRILQSNTNNNETLDKNAVLVLEPAMIATEAMTIGTNYVVVLEILTANFKSDSNNTCVGHSNRDRHRW